jgi:hypothetical protein
VFEKETGLRLFMIKSKGGNKLLATCQAKGQLTVEYLLKPSVRQNADPTALPAMEHLLPVLTARAESALKHVLEQSKPS